ncbi:PREDICTED: E3 ubiquitin-protein ligase dbl4 [Camelina sativa]|uniref:RBR-type E3 ubiquitin transferase n=1 Tax=Camelina sativa TaxID=90675 RepID=A0ABM0U6M6_CAMSA|nr:PREDICTED: E3 ubiquitin-protein ligase dbl4 [Camelina sativa]
MEKHDLTFISKKRKVDYAMTEDIPNLNGEGGSKVLRSAFTTTKFKNNKIYRLYFKGLVSDKIAMDKEMSVKVGIGIAICDEADNLLYGINESFFGDMINREEVEIIAMIIGLNEAIRLGVRNIVICYNDYEIYQIINGRVREMPNQKIVHLVDQVQRLRGKMTCTELVLATANGFKFAFSLAMDAMVSQSTSSSVDVKATPQKEVCTICFEETDAEGMFFNDKCLHRHCVSCVKRYVEVKLFSGTFPICLEDGCKSELTLESCSKVLTPMAVEMWKQKMEEDLIPVAEKIYCPYPTCSMLMSKTKLSSETDQSSNARSCIKCYGRFCIDCKVPWHSDLSCDEYKNLNGELNDMKLASLAIDNMWRQCDHCGHLIGRDEGCRRMTCKCGHVFCYICGIDWSQEECPSSCL